MTPLWVVEKPSGAIAALAINGAVAYGIKLKREARGGAVGNVYRAAVAPAQLALYGAEAFNLAGQIVEASPVEKQSGSDNRQGNLF